MEDTGKDERQIAEERSTEIVGYALICTNITGMNYLRFRKVPLKGSIPDNSWSSRGTGEGLCDHLPEWKHLLVIQVEPSEIFHPDSGT